MKKFLTILLAIGVSMLSSCNPDADLQPYEDTPKIAETILEMPLQQAINYLDKQGFYQGDISSPAGEYVFSKDAGLSHFSQDAAIMLAFGATDSVKIVFAMHRMQSEDSAYDLYWKWSHFAETVIKHEVTYWLGSLWLNKETDECQSADYCQGTMVRDVLERLDEALRSGEITQEQYNEMKASYSRDRKQYWADYKRAKGNIRSASDHYINQEPDRQPKEINMNLYMNNGGNIELYYETHNYVMQWNTTPD